MISSNFDSFKFTKFLQQNSQQSIEMKRGHSHMIIPDDLLSNVSRSRSVLHSQINEEMVSNLIKPPHRISKETSKDRKIKTLEAKVQNQTTYMNMVVHDLRNPAESIQRIWPWVIFPTLLLRRNKLQQQTNSKFCEGALGREMSTDVNVQRVGSSGV